MSYQAKKIISRNETHEFEIVDGRLQIRPREKCIHLAYYDAADTYVPNPGMGIQGYAYSDHMHVGYTAKEWAAGERRSPLEWDPMVFNRMLELDEIDNIYIRMEWKDIQKKAGELSLPPAWNSLIEAAEQKGIRWSFRIMSSSPHSTTTTSVPDFLVNKLDLVRYHHGFGFGGHPDPKYYPAYTPEYFKWWGEMLQLLGQLYDNSPNLEFADVSGFGLWGEGHHGVRDTEDEPFRNDQIGSPEEMDSAVKQLIDLHLCAFPKTPAVMSMHLTEYPSGRKALKSGKCWVRRDSFSANFKTNETKNILDMGPGGGMIWETIMPGITWPKSNHMPHQDFLDTPLRYADIGCHYAAVGFNAWDSLYTKEHYPEIFSSLQDRIGYRIRPAIIWRRSIDNGPQELVLGLKNDGSVAPPGMLTIHAQYPDDSVASVTLPTGTPISSKMELYSLSIPESVADLGPESVIRLSLQQQIKGKVYKVRWAIKGYPNGAEILEVPMYQIL